MARRLLLSLAVLAMIGTVLGLVMVDRLGRSYRQGLEVARDSAVVAAAGTTQVGQLASDVTELAVAATEALVQSRAVVESAAASTEEVGLAMSTNLADAVAGTASMARNLAGFIETAARFIPGNQGAVTADLRSVSEGLAPVPDQLRSLGDQLAATATDLRTATADLDAVVAELEQVAASIEEASGSLTDIDVLATTIAARAGQALDRSAADLLILRLLVLVLGVGTTVAALAGRRAVGVLAARHAVVVPPVYVARGEEEPELAPASAGGGTRTHTPRGTGT